VGATLLLAALALTPVQSGGDPFARARSDIAIFCDRNTECIALQREQLGYFVTMMAGFRDPEQLVAERCMRTGLEGRFVNWVTAAACMRTAVRGRRLGQ
jgi:hypothetical protein